MDYKTCTRCVMDDTDADLVFDSNGVCHVCREAEKRLPSYTFTDEQERSNLERLASIIRKRKSGDYDSILGLSGGVDSSYVALLAMDMGLTPLCVHFDNGWNSDTAVKNIRKIIDVTGFDLYTYVIDWPEFRDLQRSFFKASVLDIEVLTDHAIFAALFKIRKKHGIKTVLSGTNYATEHGMPPSWLWNKMDLRNIKAIQKSFGEITIKSFPTMNTLSWLLMRKLKIGGIFEEPLNMVNYRKSLAMERLKSRFDWQYYGGKHYESTFTKFYQAYVLPTKFGIDKRKVHLSALIRNNEITREEALNELSEPSYNQKELQEDKRFILKKLGFSETEFEKIMSESPVPHDFYPSDAAYINPLVRLAKLFMSKIN
jgi:N-acetyl sugar amidotransferase